MIGKKRNVARWRCLSLLIFSLWSNTTQSPKQFLMFLQNVWHSLQTLSFFQYSQRFLLSGNDLRQQSSRASNFDDCPKIVFHVCPQNFQETLKKKWSPAISTVFFVDVVFVLFYASQWCSEAWQWFFVIVDCQVVKHRRKDGLKLIKYFRHL